MLQKTAGIVIRNTKYSESSVISKIYTRQLGMQSYIINGLHSPKAPIKPSLLQPLTLLELVVYSNPNKNIQRIKEATSFPSLQNLHFDVIKSSIGLYIAELIHRSVMEEEPNQRLYNFLEQSVLALDEAGTGIGLFPIYFSLHLTNHLGFFPQNNFSAHDKDIFSLEEGEFTDQPVSEENAILPPDSQYFSQIISTEYEHLPSLHIPRNTRNALLIKILRYYKLHLPNFQDLKSLPVLMNVLKD